MYLEVEDIMQHIGLLLSLCCFIIKIKNAEIASVDAMMEAIV